MADAPHRNRKSILDSRGGDPGYGRMNFLDDLPDLEQRRLQAMDQYGVAMQLSPPT